MLKKTIEYVDYNGNKQQMVCWFNMSKAELLLREMGTVGGMQQMLENIANELDIKRIAEIVKDLILSSYGKKSADGQKFEKVIDGHALADDFVQTEAFSELFVELITGENALAEFVKGIIPQVLADEYAAKQNQLSVVAKT